LLEIFFRILSWFPESIIYFIGAFEYFIKKYESRQCLKLFKEVLRISRNYD